MSTIIIHHDDCLRHDPGPGHPESVQRLQAVMAGLEDLRGVERLPAPYASTAQLTLVHPEAYCDNLKDQEPGEGRFPVDSDTYMNNGSIDAALRGTGAICFAIDQLLDDRALRAFCAVRPPGHHAEPDHAMGFCLFNHVAIGARHTLTRPGFEKVAIIDFDVHHGNGTQAAFEDSPEVMFVSSHQIPLYPGTGQPHETGCGNIMNLPLSPGAGSTAFRDAWSRRGLPAIHAYDPDLILVSAGFDAHEDDPLAQLEVQHADFDWITREICALADDCCQGRVVSILEGGYNLKALARSSRAHVQGLAT